MRRSAELQNFLKVASPVAIDAMVALLDAAIARDMERLVSAGLGDVRGIQGRIAAHRALRSAILPAPPCAVVEQVDNPYS